MMVRHVVVIVDMVSCLVAMCQRVGFNFILKDLPGDRFFTRRLILEHLTASPRVTNDAIFKGATADGPAAKVRSPRLGDLRESDHLPRSSSSSVGLPRELLDSETVSLEGTD